ncbi:MAG: HlyD family efflux transporter periplasmic adaptor subunit [Candidatus Cloacimonadaceae bacterium]|nr:HlyD family efflux transporter periplasmic adaptor subunit [Candidatus Cloacimonadaceae bacterium]
MKRIMILLMLLAGLYACQRKEEGQSWTTVMEADIYRVSALAGGQISKIFVAQGQEVEPGTIIAQLDDRELRYSLEQIMGARTELLAQEQLNQTQVALAAAELEYQSRRHSRNESLFKEEMISLQSLEDGKIQVSKAELQHEAAVKNLRLVQTKKASLLAQQKSIEKKIEDCVIISAFQGRVENLYYDEGEMLPMMGLLAEIINTRSLEANIYVNEEYLARIKTQDRAKLRIKGYQAELDAQIIHISNKAEFTPKTVLTPDNRSVMVYAVRIRADNAGGILKDGMPVDVHLP